MPSKSYGGPPSFEPPSGRKQREATPASPQQVGDYLDHMVKADQEYHARKKAAGAPPPVRGNSQAAARANPPTSVPGIDEAIKKAGG